MAAALLNALPATYLNVYYTDVPDLTGLWDEYCRRCGKPVDGAWYSKMEKYKKKALVNQA